MTDENKFELGDIVKATHAGETIEGRVSRIAKSGYLVSPLGGGMAREYREFELQRTTPAAPVPTPGEDELEFERWYGASQQREAARVSRLAREYGAKRDALAAENAELRAALDATLEARNDLARQVREARAEVETLRAALDAIGKIGSASHIIEVPHYDSFKETTAFQDGTFEVIQDISRILTAAALSEKGK